MGAADKEEHGKEKQNENEKGEDEEAQAVERLLCSRGGNFTCSAHASDLDNEDESEDENKSVEELGSGERDSRDHELQAPGASLAVPVVSSSKSLVLPPHGLQQLLLPSSDTPSSVSTPTRIVCGSVTDSNGRPDGKWRGIWLGLPSKGRLYGDTLGLLKDCELLFERDNPRQYFGLIPQVWKFHEHLCLILV